MQTARHIHFPDDLTLQTPQAMQPVTVTPDGGRRSLASLKESQTESSPFQLIDPPDLEQFLRARESIQLIEAHFSSSDHPVTEPERTLPHLPRALQMHPSYLEAGNDQSKYYPNYEHPSDGNLLPDGKLHLALESVGIFPESEVVIYGTDPDGSMAASRLAWALLYAGVRKVSLLDGGIRSWITHGRSTVSHIRDTLSDIPQEKLRSSWSPRTDLLATTKEVADLTGAKLIDVRRRDEWDGSNPNHYSFFSKAGHIPTAEYQGDWKNLVDQSSDKISPMLGFIAQRWREQGILDSQVENGHVPLIFYCGTGWRSSIAFLVALSLGLRAKNYDDGFYGWSWNDQHEVIFETSKSSKIIAENHSKKTSPW